MPNYYHATSWTFRGSHQIRSEKLRKSDCGVHTSKKVETANPNCAQLANFFVTIILRWLFSGNGGCIYHPQVRVIHFLRVYSILLTR